MYKVGDIIKVNVTGIEKYGIFVNIDAEYNGLIHISEISDGFVRDVNQFVFYGEQVKVKVIDIDNVHHQARLSLKAVAKKRRFRKRKSIVETPKGFNPLREMMPRWISRGIAKEEDV